MENAENKTLRQVDKVTFQILLDESALKDRKSNY